MAVTVLLASPFTERIVSLDNFPKGGQDFELSFFLILALLCLVLLGALFGKKLVDRLLHELEWSRLQFWENPLNPLSRFAGRVLVWVPPKLSLELGAFALPLRI